MFTIYIPFVVIYFLNTTFWFSPHTCYDGIIMGELLVSKSGLGYLIMYGSQVFNINLVITSVVILGVISYLLYFIVEAMEKKFIVKKK